jgi:hypothetical protein
MKRTVACLTLALLFSTEAWAEVTPEKQAAAKPAQRPADDEAPVEELLDVDRVCVQVGPRLIRTVDPRKKSSLSHRINPLRKKFAQQYGISVIGHKIEWGTGATATMVADLLKQDPAITSVMLVHSETSTATACDLAAIGKVTSAAGKLLLADCITSAGALPLKPDEWGVDVVVTGAQKSLMIPPGLWMYILMSLSGSSLSR